MVDIRLVMPTLIRLCLFVLLCGVGLGAQEACTLCEQAHVIDCPGCKGAGTKSLPCRLCAATGKRKCRRCTGGKIRCPNYACNKGKVGVKGFMKDCKMCSGGKLDCKHCDRGKLSCVCDKKHHQLIACTDCSGGKKIPCPACRLKPFAEGCTVCADKKRRACQLCAAKTKILVRCLVCLNKRKVPCKTCAGHRKHSCNKCSGRGIEVKSVVVKKKVVRKTARCSRCKGRGTTKCTKCKNASGTMPCSACSLKRKGCGLCRRSELPCGMCTDGQLDIAKSLVASGRNKLAKGYAIATKQRLLKLQSRIESDREKVMAEMAALNEKVKANGGKHTPETLGRSLAITRQLGVLRGATKDLERALAESEAVLTGLAK